jgi:hypothetical protein
MVAQESTAVRHVSAPKHTTTGYTQSDHHAIPTGSLDKAIR